MSAYDAMKREEKQCQNCRIQFVIEPDDFAFYEKLRVPPPTFCPRCRFQRRLTWRNERNLYKRKCDAPGHEETLISMYAPGSSTIVYDHKYWWSDAWDAMQFGREYDFSRTFFEQFGELVRAVPAPNLININDTGSEYCNFTYETKNCYLNFASDFNEDSAYLYHSIYNRQSFDLLGSRKQEGCYETIDSEESYRSAFTTLSVQCLDSRFLLNCRNCEHCVGCVNLRNKKYHIFNKPYARDEYEREVAKLNLGSRKSLEQFKRRFTEFALQFPRKFADIRHSVRVTGDYIRNAKNCRDCFDVEGKAEDCRYVIYGVTDFSNVYDLYGGGANLEQSCEILVVGSNVSKTFFSAYVWDGFDNYYSYYLRGCSHCFGCVGLRNKQYCILNRQYTREEYEALVPRIIAHMNERPCMELPLPRLCPNCRHYERLAQRNSFKLYHRQCTCAGKTNDQQPTTNNRYKNTTVHFHGSAPCPNEFETTYPPERPEIVYCEQCYNAEVA